MKLKGLGVRNYNVIFHTHTVSGIIISFALFIIFYAGAFTLFRHEIYLWENQEARFETPKELNHTKVLNLLNEKYDIDGVTLLNIRLPKKGSPYYVAFGAYKDTDTTTKRFSLLIDPRDYKMSEYREAKTTLGNTLYKLHFFGQIPFRIGLYISGFISLFFLFASITGLLIHWHNLLNKFYAFIKEGKWKQIWTNAHTVLGVIGLPFQVMYAVTGALFGLLTFILLPSALILFGGDTNEVIKTVNPTAGIEVQKDAQASESRNINQLVEKINQKYPEYEINRLSLMNYGKEDGVIIIGIQDSREILKSGTITMSLVNAEIIPEFSVFPEKVDYTKSVLGLLSQLHFATFGGLSMKIIYSILALLTCFMILSGVLIWQTARNNKKYTDKQKRFHNRTTKVYLAICLGLFPATALLFIINKLVPMSIDSRAIIVESAFFISWLILVIIGLFWNNYARLNKNYLIIGGFASLLIPIANGLVTGDWFWLMLTKFPSIASVDIFWIFTGMTALIIAWKFLYIPEEINQGKNKIKISNEVREKETNILG